jgi:signal peptidase I
MSAAATTLDRPRVADDAAPRPGSIRASWGWIAVSAAARMYLSLTLSFAAVATVPVLFGWQATVVQTGSMLPHIRPGDVVVTMPLSANMPAPLGGVVSFHTAAQANADGVAATRLHRIVDVNLDGTFVTQGDANHDADSDPLTRPQIIGQARLLVPLVGLPSLWFGAGNVVALISWVLASIAAVLVVAFERPAPARARRDNSATSISQES